MSKRYSVIYADPPWSYGNKMTNQTKKPCSSADDHYQTMATADIKKLNVKDICEDDCLLFMWTSSPHLEQAISLMKAWGFEYKTVAFVWDKQSVNPGAYTMSGCELCLVGKRKGGKIPQPRGARNVRQFISEKRGKHSAKPSEVRSRINEMFPTQNKLEMFARTTDVGWDCWGNEVDSDIKIGITNANE